MGMFTKLYNNEDASFNDEDKELEELYEKLFKKIARDFIYRGEIQTRFENLFLSIEQVNPELARELRENNSFYIGEEAKIKAIEYKENLRKQKNKRSEYKDVDDE